MWSPRSFIQARQWWCCLSCVHPNKVFSLNRSIVDLATSGLSTAGLPESIPVQMVKRPSKERFSGIDVDCVLSAYSMQTLSYQKQKRKTQFLQCNILHPDMTIGVKPLAQWGSALISPEARTLVDDQMQTPSWNGRIFMFHTTAGLQLWVPCTKQHAST